MDLFELLTAIVAAKPEKSKGTPVLVQVENETNPAYWLDVKSVRLVDGKLILEAS